MSGWPADGGSGAARGRLRHPSGKRPSAGRASRGKAAEHSSLQWAAPTSAVCGRTLPPKRPGLCRDPSIGLQPIPSARPVGQRTRSKVAGLERMGCEESAGALGALAPIFPCTRILAWGGSRQQHLYTACGLECVSALAHGEDLPDLPLLRWSDQQALESRPPPRAVRCSVRCPSSHDSAIRRMSNPRTTRGCGFSTGSQA